MIKDKAAMNLKRTKPKRHKLGFLLISISLIFNACSPGSVEDNNNDSKTDEVSSSADSGKKKILFIAGNTQHRHGYHEYRAGSMILAKALNDSGLPVEASVHWYGWPEDESIFDGVDACIVYADSAGNFGEKYAFLDEKYKNGMALMFMHYGVHPTKEVGEKYYKKWIGGYFDDKFSVNPSWIADIAPKEGHPVGSGLSKPVTAYDEFYWNLDFPKDCEDCYPLGLATPTEKNMVRYGSSKFWNKEAADKLNTPQALLWCRDPKGLPRGAGFVGGHYHRNWAIDEYRKLILNTIAWVAGMDIPKDGVQSETITKAMLNENLNRPDHPEDVELPTADLLTQPAGKKPILGPDGRVPPRAKKKKSNLNTQTKAPTTPAPVASPKPVVAAPKKVAKHRYPLKSAMPWPPTLDPETINTSTFALDAELEVTLWAKSPMLYNPTNMDIDPMGRIWVNEGVNYREKLGVRREAGDRVVVLSDTNGDGTADKSQVFIQDPMLESPLGIAVFDNQIVISQPPEIIIYTDVNRNLKFDKDIDKKEIFLTGFNGRQHDHSLHSVTSGPDGKWYFNSGNCGGIFTDKSGKTFRMNTKYRGGASEQNFYTATNELNGAKSDDGYVWSSGFSVRINPDGTDAEIIGHGYRNSYEQVVNSFGDMFQSDNDDYSSCRNSYVLEYGSAGYYSLDGQHKWQTAKRPGQAIPRAHWRQDNPGTFDTGDVYGAGGPTGVTFYENGALSEKWNGTYLSCEATRSTIFSYKPKPQGANFELKRSNFLTSQYNPKTMLPETDEQIDKRIYFRPSDISVGPDGAIYVADWYDAGSGGHSTSDETASGAIYRIAPKSFKSKIPAIDLSSIAGQIEVLKNPSPSVRYLGFNALKAQGDKAYASVNKLLDHKNPYIAARAIWLLPHLGKKGIAQAEALLKHSNPQYRLVAFRSLRRSGRNMLQFARLLANDSDAGVRRDVAISLSPYTVEETKDIVSTLAKGYDGKDKNYVEAIGLGSRLKEEGIWKSLKTSLNQSDVLSWTDSFARITWRLWTTAALEDLKTRALSDKLSIEQRLFAIESIAFIDDAKAPDALFKLSKQIEVKEIQDVILGWITRQGLTQWSKYNIKDRLKESGIYDPESITLYPVQVPKLLKESPYTVEDVAKLTGDPEKGKTAILRCTMCHEVNGVGPNFGPRLEGWAIKQTKGATITAIVYPSRGIAHGFKGTEFTLKDGTVIQGITEVNGDPTTVLSQGGVSQTIPGSRIKNKSNMKRSLMLSADQLGLTAQDVADIVAYMKQWE